MTKNDVVFLHQNINAVFNIRNSKVAYAVLKNSKKIAKEREVIVETLNKMRGEVAMEKFIEQPEAIEFLGSECDIQLHKLDSIPEGLEVTATELLVLDFMTVETEDTDDNGGKPVGPKVKK